MFYPWIRKIPWRRECQHTPVFLPENSKDGRAWWVTVHGITRVGHDLVTKPPPPPCIIVILITRKRNINYSHADKVHMPLSMYMALEI